MMDNIFKKIKEKIEARKERKRKEREEYISKVYNQLLNNNYTNKVPLGYFKCSECNFIRKLNDMCGFTVRTNDKGEVGMTFYCINCANTKGYPHNLDFNNVKEDLIKKNDEVLKKYKPKKNNLILEKYKESEIEGKNISQALKNPETLKEYHKTIDMLHEELKDVSVDKNVLKKMAKEHPDSLVFQDVKNPEEYKTRDRALYYSLKGDFKKAIEYSDMGIKINPKSAYLFYMRGRSKGDIGQFKEGITDLTKSIKLRPDFADAFVERGYIKKKIGNEEGAEKDYSNAKKINPYITLPK